MQTDREASPSTVSDSDSELPAGTDGVDNGAMCIRGSESANGVGVLMASGGGVFGEGGDDLTEEERETVSHVCVEHTSLLVQQVWVLVTYISQG